MTLAVYEALLDHNNDGDFLDANEDVTSRVLARSPVTLTRGLDTIRVGSPPMAGEMNGVELQNRDRLLSSFNSGSALAGNLKPGRRFQFRATRISDTFTRANGALGAADLGGTWSVVRGTFAVNTNQAQVTGIDATYADAMAVIDAGTSNGVYSVTFATLQDSQRLYFRLVDQHNWLAVEVFGVGTIRVVQDVASSFSSIASAAHTWASGDVVRTELWGDSIKVFVNGVLRITTTSTRFLTATKYGLGKGNAIGTTGRFDDFKVSTALFNGLTRTRKENAAPGNRTVAYTALGMLAQVAKAARRGKTQGGLYTTIYFDKRVDELAGVILDACGLTDTRYRVFDRCYTIVRVWALKPDDDPLEELFKLVRSEDGLLFEDGFGRLVIKSRLWRDLDPRSSVAQVTIHDAAPDEPRFTDVFELDEGHYDVVNDVQFPHRRRQLQPLAVVWELADGLTLSANESVTFDIDLEDPITGALTPVTNTDFVVTAGSLSLSPTLIGGTSGYRVKLRMDAGAGGAVLSFLRLRAQSAAVVEERTITQTVSTAASKADYGTIVYPHDVIAEVDAVVLEALANRIVNRRKDVRATLTYQVKNANATRLSEILSREIGDRIAVEEAQTGIDTGDEWFITQISHEIDWGAGTHVTTFGAELAEAAASTLFQLGVSGLSGGHKLG